MLSMIIAAIWVIPVCYISAISGQPAAINLLAQIVPGAIWPERPFLNMVRIRTGGTYRQQKYLPGVVPSFSKRCAFKASV